MEGHPQVSVITAVNETFSEAVEEVFVDGMESVFSRNLHTVIRSHRDMAIDAIDRVLRFDQPSAEVAGEALRQVGFVDDPPSHQRRLALILDHLDSSDPRIRDAASVGITALDDPVAIPRLREALLRENLPRLRRNLQLVLDQLKATRQWPAS